MTFEQAFLFYQAAPVLFVIVVLFVGCVALWLTCWATCLWQHSMRGAVGGYKSICERLSEAVFG